MSTQRILLLLAALAALEALPVTAASATKQGSLEVEATVPDGAAAVRVDIESHGRVVRAKHLARRFYRRVRTAVQRRLRPGRYTLVPKPVPIDTSVGAVEKGAMAYPARDEIPLRIERGKTRHVDVAYTSIVNPGVEPLPTDRVAAVLGDPDSPLGLVLSHGDPPHVGTILTSERTEHLPSGMIAEVIAVDESQDEMVVWLVPAQIHEATPMLSGRPEPQTRQGLTLPAQARLVLSQITGPGCSKKLPIRFGARVDGLAVREFTLNRWPAAFRFRATMSLHARFELPEKASFSCSAQWDLAEYPAVLPVGPIALPVFVGMPITVEVSGNGAVGLKAIELYGTANLNVDTRHPLNFPVQIEHPVRVDVDTRPSGLGTVTASASIALKAGVGVRHANVHVASDFGPEISWSSTACSLHLKVASITAGGTLFIWGVKSPAWTAYRRPLGRGCAGDDRSTVRVR